MNVRKSLTAIGAALFFISVGASAEPFDCTNDDGQNDPAVISEGLIEIAEDLRCVKDKTELNDGRWGLPPSSLAPIWEKRREPSCEIHLKLSRNLYELRDFETNPTRPPKNKNNTNLAAGAAYALLFEKYDDALSKLESFRNAANKATLNRYFDDAADWRMLLIKDIDIAHGCVYQLSIQE